MKLQHQAPSLQAEIVGELDRDAGLALFRGIPYATVQKRWTHSRVRHTLESPFNATGFGPRCVQANGAVLVSGGLNDPVPGDDEFDCLNLNITVPEETLAARQNGVDAPLLPVMFWIHGGAFNYGANSVARYRPGKLCSIAKQARTPIILVQIGYRLGPLGFAASNDLKTESNSTKANGGVNGHSTPQSEGNYGFVDQRNALEWVRDHIADFGGDPWNVTAFGISAGSASVHYHILTGSPLFDRAIMMSGSAPTIGPLPFDLYEKNWKLLCNNCGVEGSTAAERLQQLRAIHPLNIIENYSRAALGPMADGNLLPSSWHLGDQQPSSRCKSVILGDTGVEAIILDDLSRAISQPRFHELIRSAFSHADAQSFAASFGFTSDNLPYEKYRDAMRHFLSVLMFQYPNLRIAESYSQAGEAYLYHFEEPSTYPGPTLGIPYHGQCALYMYNNEIDVYPPSGRRVALDMAQTWTAFAHGNKPWEPYVKAHRFMRFGPQGAMTLQDVETDKTRDYRYIPWLREHFEDCKVFTQRLLQDAR